MAVTTDASTGTNTSATQQAVVKATVGGCLTSALATALESQLIIEFPDAITGTTVLAALSSVAVNQIVTQLVADTEFQTQLSATLSTDTYIQQNVDAVLASTQFQTELAAAVSTALTTAENIQTIEDALCASTTFQSCVTSVVVASEALTTVIDSRIDTQLAALDLFVCTEDTYVVSAARTINIPVTGMTNNNYFVSYVVTAYTPTGSGDANDSIPQTGSRQPTFYPITFPNADAGDEVTIHSVRIRC